MQLSERGRCLKWTPNLVQIPQPRKKARGDAVVPETAIRAGGKPPGLACRQGRLLQPLAGSVEPTTQPGATLERSALTVPPALHAVRL